MDLQLRHLNCDQDSDRTELLVELQHKLNVATDSHYRLVWSSLRKWRNYDVTGTIIACSDYDRKIDFIHCGYSFGPYRFACRDVLCPRCAYMGLAKPLLDEFGDVAVSGVQVFYVVVSLSGNTDQSSRLIFRDADRSDLVRIKRQGPVPACSPADYGVEFGTKADIEQIRLWWEIIREEVRDFVTKGQRRGIRGAVGGPELAVQFGPLRVQPHANFVLWADHFTVEDARQLRRLLTKRMRDSSRFHLKVHPSVACFHLASPKDVRAMLQYSTKPIELAGAYIRAAERVEFEPAAMTRLNAEVNQFLHYLPDAFHQVRRVERYGGCHAGSKTYFGIVTPRRAALRARDAERRRVMRRNGAPTRAAARSSHGGDAPKALRRRASSRYARFSYWFAATQPSPPPPPPTRTCHSSK